MTNALVAAVTNGAGAALGSLASARLGELVVQKIAAQYGLQAAARKVVESMVKGSLASTVQSVVVGTPDLLRGKTTWDQFATAVMGAFLMGAVGGFITGKLSKTAPELESVPPEELEAAATEIGAGKIVETPPKLGALKLDKQRQHTYALAKGNENAGTLKRLGKPDVAERVKAGTGDPNPRIDKMLKTMNGNSTGASLLNEKFDKPAMQAVIRQKVQAELDAGHGSKLHGGGRQMVLDMHEPTGWVLDKDLNGVPTDKLRVDIAKDGQWHFFPTN